MTLGVVGVKFIQTYRPTYYVHFFYSRKDLNLNPRQGMIDTLRPIHQIGVDILPHLIVM